MYEKRVCEDVRDYLRENFRKKELLEMMEDRDEFEQRLHDDLWIEDSVTGNGSGSYTFSRSEARDCCLEDMETVIEAVKEFCIEAETVAEKFLSEDWEYFDVTARCYVLGWAISEALDDLANEIEREGEE